MDKVTGKTRLRDIAVADVSVMAILSRFGMKPGYGKMTVEEACKKTGTDVPLFLLVINVYLGKSEDYGADFPEVQSVMNFISLTDSFYERVQLPNILRHLRPVGESREVIERYVRNLSLKFERRRIFDELTVYPNLRNGQLSSLPEHVISQARLYDKDLESELEDLLEFFVVHIESDLDPNMLLGVITAIDSMRRDVKKINEIREKILYQGPEDFNKDREEEETGKGDTQLTQREKEVIVLLAEGLSSKEIAERLCISANTAITHRRNISAKLGIKSIAGLLLYAYTHNLVELPK